MTNKCSCSDMHRSDPDMKCAAAETCPWVKSGQHNAGYFVVRTTLKTCMRTSWFRFAICIILLRYTLAMHLFMRNRISRCKRLANPSGFMRNNSWASSNSRNISKVSRITVLLRFHHLAPSLKLFSAGYYGNITALPMRPFLFPHFLVVSSSSRLLLS